MAMTKTDAIDLGDLFTVFKLEDADYRAATTAALLAFLQANLVFPGGYTVQYSSPSNTGFTVAINAATGNMHLLLTPLAAYAAGTLTLPAASGMADGVILVITCTQAITTLTLALNGATGAVGAPTTLAANAFFTMKFDKPSNNWYRIG